MRIWVDADGLPRDLTTIVCRAAERTQTKAIFVANKPLRLPPSPWVSSVQVARGLDEADLYIANESSKEDLVITADVPLADAVVKKGVTAIDPRGQLYTEDTIRERVSIRDFMAGLRAAGTQTGGPAPYGDKEKQRFAASFDAMLHKLKRDS